MESFPFLMEKSLKIAKFCTNTHQRGRFQMGSLWYLAKVQTSTFKTSSFEINSLTKLEKHCQRHNGPEGWVHISRSQSWPNLASEYWPRFNFINSTKNQQRNTDQTSASKSFLNLNFKLLTKVLTVCVKLYDQTSSASKSATNCCQLNPYH